MNAGKNHIEAPPIVMPRRLSPVARAAIPVFAATAGLMIGLAIGAFRKSESRQWIDAERDRLAQKAEFLDRWKKDLDDVQRDWGPFRAKRDEIAQELASARRERNAAVEEAAKAREELARLPPPAAARSDELIGEAAVVGYALGSTRRLVAIPRIIKQFRESLKESDVVTTFIWWTVLELKRDAEIFRKHEALSRMIVDAWIASVEKGGEREFAAVLRDHFDKDVFGPER